jgi:hypothetical protein
MTTYYLQPDSVIAMRPGIEERFAFFSSSWF